MPTNTRPRISAELRTGARKKSELKRLRSAGQIPGVIFGHGDPEPIKAPARAISEFLRHHAAGGMVDLVLGGAAPTPALLRHLDRDPITGRVTHLELQRVNLSETIKATVPLTFTGEETLIKNELVLQRQTSEIEVHARADALPDEIVIDVSEQEAGTSIRIADLKLPQGVEATADPDLPVATISTPSLPADVAAALDAEEVAHAELVASHADHAEEAEEEEAVAAGS
ncbi:MAG: 50S ribosomal protein L25 [Actinomycetota bacterium]